MKSDISYFPYSTGSKGGSAPFGAIENPLSPDWTFLKKRILSAPVVRRLKGDPSPVPGLTEYERHHRNDHEKDRQDNGKLEQGLFDASPGAVNRIGLAENASQSASLDLE
jgi:hypothetical protein